MPCSGRAFAGSKLNAARFELDEMRMTILILGVLLIESVRSSLDPGLTSHIAQWLGLSAPNVLENFLPYRASQETLIWQITKYS